MQSRADIDVASVIVYWMQGMYPFENSLLALTSGLAAQPFCLYPHHQYQSLTWANDIAADTFSISA